MPSPIRQHDLQVNMQLEAVGHFVGHRSLVPLVPFDEKLIGAVSERKDGGLGRTDGAVFTVGIGGQSGTGWAPNLGNQEEVRTLFERKKFGDRKSELLTPATNMRSNDGDCGFSLFTPEPRYINDLIRLERISAVPVIQNHWSRTRTCQLIRWRGLAP